MHLTGYGRVRYQVLLYIADVRLIISVDLEDFSAYNCRVKQYKTSEHFLSKSESNTINGNPVTIYQATRRHIPEDTELQKLRLWNLKYRNREGCGCALIEDSLSGIFLEGLKKPRAKFWSVCSACHCRLERGNFRTPVTKYTASAEFVINPQHHSMN